MEWREEGVGTMWNSWDRGGSKRVWGEVVLRPTDTQQVKGMGDSAPWVGQGRAGNALQSLEKSRISDGSLAAHTSGTSASCAHGDGHGKTSMCQ